MSGEIQPGHDVDLALIEPIRNTLRDVLRNPEILRQHGGKDGKLSHAQAALALAVTVLMQDELASEARRAQERLVEQMSRSHARETFLLTHMRRLYMTPVFQSPQVGKGESPAIQLRRPFRGLFTWGNLIGGAAIVLVAMAFLVTNLTSNYERQWKSAEADARLLREKLESAVESNEALTLELHKAKAVAEASDAALKTISAGSADSQAKLLQVIEDLSAERGKVAAQVAASSGEKTFQKLYEQSQKEIEKLRADNAKLLKRAVDAEARLNAKESAPQAPDPPK